MNITQHKKATPRGACGDTTKRRKHRHTRAPIWTQPVYRDEVAVAHRLTRIRRPQANGMVECFNRRLSEVLAAKDKIADNSGKNCFSSHAERNAYLMDFVYNCNRTRLKCLNYNSPLQSPHNYAKLYTFAGMTMFFVFCLLLDF